MKRLTTYLTIILLSVVLLSISCSKQQLDFDSNNDKDRNNPDKFFFIPTMSIIEDQDRDNYYFEEQDPYNFNAYFGAGALGHFWPNVTYEDVATIINDYSTDVFTILAFDEAKQDYIFYLQEWVLPDAPLSIGGYIYLNNSSSYFYIGMELQEGAIGDHTGRIPESENSDIKKKFSAESNQKSMSFANQFEIILVEDDGDVYYLNENSINYDLGFKFYSGFMSPHGLDPNVFAKNAVAIYDVNKDALGFVAENSITGLIIQYNLHFTSPTENTLEGFYMYNPVAPYYYSAGATLTKGQLGDHIAE